MSSRSSMVDREARKEPVIWWLITAIAALLIAATLLDANMHVLRGIAALLVFAAAAAVWLSFGSRHRPMAAILSGLILAIGILGAWSIPANWDLDAGRAAHDSGDTSRSETYLRQALARMDEPGIDLSVLRYRLTIHGPVYISRVTTMVELAEIAAADEHWSEAHGWLSEAYAAGMADPSEQADLERIDAMRTRAAALAE